MIIDGRALAKEVLARTKMRTAVLLRPPRVLAISANETPATKSYLAIKTKRATDAGCVLEVRQFPESVSAQELQLTISESNADAIIVQLPLPAGVDVKTVCDTIPVEKDADVLSTAARMKFEADEGDALIPPVAKALAEICSVNGINMVGKKAIVIGQGWLVGKPCATWLSHAGADVSHLSFRAGDFTPLKGADLIVSGAGSPHFIKPEMLKDGVILIDAGTSESDGALAGDADPACAEKCSFFTPVPGGIGPLAVACLFENAVILTERAMNT